MMKKLSSRLIKALSVAFASIFMMALSLVLNIGSIFTAKASGISVDSLINVNGDATVTAGKATGYNDETGLTVNAKDGGAYGFDVNGVFTNDTRLDFTLLPGADKNSNYFAFQIADALNPNDYFLVEIYPIWNWDYAGSQVYLNYEGAIRFTGNSGAMGLVETVEYHGATYSLPSYDAREGSGWATTHNNDNNHYQRNASTAIQMNKEGGSLGFTEGSYLTIRYDGDVMEIVVPRIAMNEQNFVSPTSYSHNGEQVVARFDGTTELKNGKTSVRANQYNLPKLDWEGYTIRGISTGVTDIALQKITTGTNTATQDTTSTPDTDPSDGVVSIYKMTSTWENKTEVSLAGMEDVEVPAFMAQAMQTSYIEFANEPAVAVKAGVAMEVPAAKFVNYATNEKVDASVSVSNGGEFVAVGSTYVPATAGEYTLRYTAGESQYDVAVMAYDYTPATEEAFVSAVTNVTTITSAPDNAIRDNKTMAGLLIDGTQGYQADINGIFKGDTRIDFTPVGIESAAGDLIFRITDAKTGWWYEVVFWTEVNGTYCAVYDGSRYVTAHNSSVAQFQVYSGSREDIESKGGNNAKTRIYCFQGVPTHVTFEWYGDILEVCTERQNFAAGSERIVARFDGSSAPANEGGAWWGGARHSSVKYGLPKFNKDNGYTISVRSTDSNGSAVILNKITNNGSALVFDGDNAVNESPAFYTAQNDLVLNTVGTNNTVVYGENENAYTLGTTGGSGEGAVSYAVVSGPATVAGNVLTVTGAGEVVLKATKASDGTYIPAYATATLTVEKAAQAALVINAINDGQVAMGDNNTYTLGTTGGSGEGAISYAVVSGPATVEGNALTVTGVGSVVIKATKASDNNYNEVVSAEYTLTVVKGTKTITISGIDSSVKFGANDNSYTLTCGVSGVTYTVVSGPATLEADVLTVTGVGEVVLKADLAESANYEAATATLNVTVVKGEQAVLSIVGVDANTTYTAEAITLATNGGNGNGAVSYAITAGDNATVEGTTLTLTKAGTFTITATKAGDDNYNATTATLVVTVAKANQSALTISGIDATIRYSETDNVFAITVSGGNTDAAATLLSSDTILATVDGMNVTVLGVGTFTLTVTKGGDDKYNETTATFDIVVLKNLQATLTIQAIGADNTVVYGDNENTYTLAVNGGNGTGAVTYTVVSGPATVEGNVLTVTGAGEVVLQAAKAGNVNYEAAVSEEYTLTVAKKAQAALVLAPIVEGNEVVFDAANNTYTLTVSGGTGTGELYFVVKSGPATVEGNVLTVTGEGTVVVYAVKEGNANMLDAVSEEVTLVVKAAEQPKDSASADQGLAFGCKASIGCSLVAMMTVVGAGLVLRKKRED